MTAGGRSGSCRRTSKQLSALLDGADLPQVSDHVGQCLQCQAELARYRRLRRSTRHLSEQVVEPPVGILASILAALDAGEQIDGPRRVLWPLLIAGGGAIGGLAMAAVVAWLRRRRLAEAC
jgi:hypothetical protein